MTGDEQRIGLGAGGVLLVVSVGLLIRDLAGGLPVWPDVAWSTLMSTHRWAPAVGVAHAMAWIGASGVWIATGSAMLLAVAARRWRSAIAVLLAAELGALASSAIKHLIARPRPPGGLDVLSSFSFPSGHATWAAAVAASLALSMPRVWAWVFAASWIAFMAWSRTYLGVHWLSDVAAGALLGVSVALLAAGLIGLLAPGGRSSPPPVTLAS